VGQVMNAYALKRQSVLNRPISLGRVQIQSREVVRALAGLACFALVVGGVSFYQQTGRELKRAVAQRETEVARKQSLEVDIDKLELEIHRLRADPAVIESMGRSMGLIRPGDMVLRTGPQGSASVPAMSATGAQGADAASAQAVKPARIAKAGVKSGALTSPKSEGYTVNSY
jgi:hypothetical protein